MKRALLTVVVFLLPVLLHAAKKEKWYEAYDRGVAAARAGNHSVAVLALQAAIAEQPTESAAARGGRESFVYVPHFWLGIAKFNLGDDDAALKEFKTSEDQGVVQNTRYYSDLREWLARVQAARQKNTDSIAAEGRRIAGAASKSAVSAQMDAVSAGGDRSETYRSGQRKLVEARDVSSKAGSDLKEYRRAAGIAAQARDLFVAAAEEARKQRVARPVPSGTAQRPAVNQAAQPQTVGEKAREAPPAEAPSLPSAVTQQPPAGAEPKMTGPPPLSAALADVRVVVQQYRRKLTDSSPQLRADSRLRDWTRSATREAETWQKLAAGTLSDDAARALAKQIADRDRELGLRLAQLEQKAADTAGPMKAENLRPALERAWRVYASGDLMRAEELLTQILAGTQSPEAYLLRACGRFTQATLARKGASLLTSADADFRSALRINPALRLDRRNFSPKLIAHFDNLRGK